MFLSKNALSLGEKHQEHAKNEAMFNNKLGHENLQKCFMLSSVINTI